MWRKGKREVEIIFACGHKGFAAKSLFKEGESVDIQCRVCKPSMWRWLIPIIGIIASVAIWLLTR